MVERDIINIQNETHFINLLKAQRVAYSQAKKLQFIDAISILIAVSLPIIAYFNPQIITAISAIGVVWTLVYLITEVFRKRKTIEGAKIQEQFDTELFEIPTNQVLVKSFINRDKIYDLASKIKNKDKFKNWYSTKIKSELPKNIKILLCQRINSSWEYDLRRRFVFLLIATIAVYYALFFTVFIVNNIGIFDILLLIMPSLSFLIFGVKHSSTLISQINSKDELLTTIDKLLDNYKKQKQIPEPIELRQIQDIIYSQRTISEKIPDWFYNMFRKYNENKTDTIIEEINSKL